MTDVATMMGKTVAQGRRYGVVVNHSANTADTVHVVWVNENRQAWTNWDNPESINWRALTFTNWP